VSKFVAEEHQARGGGLLITLSIGESVVAPAMFGLFSNVANNLIAQPAVAVLALTTIPLCAAFVRPLSGLQYLLC
jgi:hypothetical protein